MILSCVAVLVVFNCYGPVDGEYFVHSDMAIQCFSGDHFVASLFSGLVVAIWAFAVPIFVAWMGCLQPDTHTDPRFKFLFGK
jgi:hypothetical protein